MAKVKYTPNRDGFREMANSDGVRDTAMQAASRVANWARGDDPDGSYEVRPTTVQVGWRNENRRGASVVETQRGQGHRKRTLARGVEEAR